jgi:ABC-2 type transport system ATP-binding protein
LNAAIRVDQLTKVFGKGDKGLTAVDHVTFDIREGELFGFLGPNGAGKTTTQRMLTSLLEPTSGQIRILGRKLSEESVWIRERLGVVPEESNIYTELSGWDNLVFTGQLYRMPRQARAARAEELLRSFDLWGQHKLKAENYSKGMRRRLSIAMGIIHKPQLLFLDEPTPGLDAHSVRVIWEIIRDLNARGTTVFMTTHQIEEANQLCDRVAIIHAGRLAAIDTPENLKRSFQRVQSVEVSFRQHGREHYAALQHLPGVLNTIKTGDKRRFYTEDPSSLVKRIAAYAGESDLDIVTLSILGPSLEEVFIEITGGIASPRLGSHKEGSDAVS